MSHIYDNWERLVAAVLKREQNWKLCHSDSLSSSFSSVSSDFSSSFADRLSLDLQTELLTGQTPLDAFFRLFAPISFSTSHLDLNSGPKTPKPPKVPSGSRIGRIAGAARQFVTPAIMRPERRKLSRSLFLPGVPNLGRSELEAACEDFSNILIGSSSTCILYKGTLSSGVEIAVSSSPAQTSANYWPVSLEALFRTKIEKLIKVNHENFANIIGLCSEEEPFTRMMVFEYAPNGTLFEYLHIREGERLDWAKRLRISMGIAYCLEHMHQMTPPLSIRNLTSSNVYLTEDYAAKLSDFFYLDNQLFEVDPNLQSNVYSFGVILLEIVTGRHPYTTTGDYSLSNYLKRVENFRDMVDPNLETYEEDQVDEIGALIKFCVNLDPKKRPQMREACAHLSKITSIGLDGAIPENVEHSYGRRLADTRL